MASGLLVKFERLFFLVYWCVFFGTFYFFKDDMSFYFIVSCKLLFILSQVFLRICLGFLYAHFKGFFSVFLG